MSKPKEIIIAGKSYDLIAGVKNLENEAQGIVSNAKSADMRIQIYLISMLNHLASNENTTPLNLFYHGMKKTSRRLAAIQGFIEKFSNLKFNATYEVKALKDDEGNHVKGGFVKDKGKTDFEPMEKTADVMWYDCNVKSDSPPAEFTQDKLEKSLNSPAKKAITDLGMSKQKFLDICSIKFDLAAKDLQSEAQKAESEAEVLQKEIADKMAKLDAIKAKKAKVTPKKEVKPENA